MSRKKPLEVMVAVTKNKAGKVVIIKRCKAEKAANDQELTWGFPSGKIRTEEDPVEAVVRETENETGYKIKVIKKISDRVYPKPYVHLNYYACELASFRVTPIHDIHEVEKVKWVDPKELGDYFTTDIDPKVAKYLGV